MNVNPSLYIVTGANGWLGKAVVQGLIQGFQNYPNSIDPVSQKRVSAFVLPDQEVEFKSAFPNIECIVGNICFQEDCDRLLSKFEEGILIHTAGIIHPKRAREFNEINSLGTRNIMNAAVRAKVQRAVHISSNSPFGFNPHSDHLFDELSPYNPYMGYGKSKCQAELYVREVAEKTDLQTTIIRAPWFYGPNQPVRQTLFFDMIRKGKVPVIGNGNNLRSMTYIDNLVYAILLASRSPKARNKAFWIADKQPYSMNEIIETIRNVMKQDFDMKVKPKCVKLPQLVGRVAEILDGFIQKLGFYHQKIHVLSEMGRSIACSIEFAEKELGYKPIVELKEGMHRSLKWCIENGFLER